nr:reverse transcriptase domain-containing protein [Tanacetum cinerariifolium]
MSSNDHSTSNNEDAFSSNIQDYVSTIPDYSPASSGKTYSNASIVILLPSLVLSQLPISDSQDFFPSEEISPKDTETSVSPSSSVGSSSPISKCAEEDRVTFATSTLTNDALSWWNAYAQPIGIEQANKITWTELKRILTNKYCPRTEIKKTEDEFYDLTVKRNDLKTYIRRFQELALLCPNMVPNSEKLIEVFIGGLPRSIEGNVTASKPQTLEEVITITQRLMEQNKRQEAIRAYAVNPTKDNWTSEIHRISFVTKEDISETLPCQLPPKEMNPGSFTLPYTIGNLRLYAMADLGVGVNVKPKLLFEHLKLVDLKETSMVVEMADMKKKSPLGIVKNILVKIDKFLFHSDFVVIDMLEGLNVTILLEPLDLVHHYLIEVRLRDDSRVKDVVQHKLHFILEIVDNGFGSLAMRALMNLRSMRLLDLKRLIKRNKEKVKALGANGEVSGFGVRVVWMVVDGGTVRADGGTIRAKLVSREVAKVVLLLLRD